MKLFLNFRENNVSFKLTYLPHKIHDNFLSSKTLKEHSRHHFFFFFNLQKMACLTNQFVGLKCPRILRTRNKNLGNPIIIHTKQKIVCKATSVGTTNAQTRERLKLKEMFEEAYERCRIAPMEGVGFTVEDFHSALEKYDFDSDMGTKVSSYCLDYEIFVMWFNYVYIVVYL